MSSIKLRQLRSNRFRIKNTITRNFHRKIEGYVNKILKSFENKLFQIEVLIRLWWCFKNNRILALNLLKRKK